MANKNGAVLMGRDVMEVLAEWPHIVRTERGALVRTSCVLPSGSLLNVSVQPAIDGWIVSDEGSAAWEAESGGHSVADAMPGLKKKLSQQGLRLENGKIFSGRVSSSELPFMVAYLATAALDASVWLGRRAARPERQDLAARLRAHLKKEFPDLVMPEPLTILGDTDKKYTFANVLSLPNKTRVILDPVLRQDSSIKSRIVANIDVARARHKNIIQRIVYDDGDEWSQPELALLAVGAPTVPYSEIDGVVRRMVA